MKNFILLLLVIISASCNKEELFADDAKINLWLNHQGAEMPIAIEGNTNSKTFLIFIHGGPGGSAHSFNNFFTPFSDVLEEDYALVYWDQRNSGLSRGEWDINKITIDQYVDDLDQVIELIKFKFGADASLFLVGSSWGGYLSQAYLTDQTRQSKIKAWISISGLHNRNQNVKDALQKIIEIGNEQIALGINAEDWTDILDDVQIERDRNIQQYGALTENIVFSFIRKAENIIRESEVLTYNLGSSYQSVYRGNSHPFILASNKRVLDFLVPQMYTFDNDLETLLPNISLPSLFLYGKFDVRTPLTQGEFVLLNISTEWEDKTLFLFDTSDHSSIGNQPVELADSVITWVEKYK